MSSPDNILAKMKAQGIKMPEKRTGPLWKGPQEDGITYSLLSRFLVCRERFRLLVCEGLKANEGWNHRLGYGNMWHVCEEAYASPDRGPENNLWATELLRYAQQEAKAYPLQSEMIEHWYKVCDVQFQAYIDYWKNKQISSTPILQEHSFSTPYHLPSGRTVRLRGKWDSVYDTSSDGIWLQENKTKGDINPTSLERQLKFDLQTMLYLVALEQWCKGYYTVSGVMYNVVRRPLSGGKGTIVRHKATANKPEESKSHYYNRLSGIIMDDPGHFFMRWKVEITQEDIVKFKDQCLDPILEQLCDWWDWVSKGDPWRHGNDIHWRHPYGVYNVLNEGGSTDTDEYLDTGSEVGLTRTDNLFPELT